MARHQRKADGGIHRVIHRGRAIGPAHHAQGDLVRAQCLQRLVCEEAVDREIGHEQPLPTRGNSLGKLAPLCATIVERDRQLALVETLPIETLPLRAERPAARVGPSADLVDTDNPCAHLCEVKRT